MAGVAELNADRSFDWRSLLEIDYADLVRAYVQMYQTNTDYPAIRRLLARISSAQPASVVFPGLARVLAEQACDEVGIALVVLGGMGSCTQVVLDGGDPGLFRRDVFSAIFGGARRGGNGVTVSTSHAEYLAGRVVAMTEGMGLSCADVELGQALATAWQGTFAELIDTTRDLLASSALPGGARSAL